MPRPTPRGILKAVLLLLALDATLKAVIVLFAQPAHLLRVFPGLPAGELTTFAVVMWRGHAAATAAIGLMLWIAARDPIRYDAVVYGITVGLVIAAGWEVASLYALDAGRFFSVPVTVGHALVRMAVAGLLVYLLARAKDQGGYAVRG